MMSVCVFVRDALMRVRVLSAALRHPHLLAMVAMLCLCGGSALAQRSTPVQLLHPAGAVEDRFGQSVAVDGDTMIVGAFRDDVGTNADQGSAHVYRWAGSGWVLSPRSPPPAARHATTWEAGGCSVDLRASSVLSACRQRLIVIRANRVTAQFHCIARNTLVNWNASPWPLRTSVRCV